MVVASGCILDLDHPSQLLGKIRDRLLAGHWQQAFAKESPLSA
jgi:hypothetical protein